MMGPCEVMFIRGRWYSEGWNGCGVWGLSGLLSRVRWGIGCGGARRAASGLGANGGVMRCKRRPLARCKRCSIGWVMLVRGEGCSFGREVFVQVGDARSGEG